MSFRMERGYIRRCGRLVVFFFFFDLFSVICTTLLGYCVACSHVFVCVCDDG